MAGMFAERKLSKASRPIHHDSAADNYSGRCGRVNGTVVNDQNRVEFGISKLIERRNQSCRGQRVKPGERIIVEGSQKAPPGSASTGSFAPASPPLPQIRRKPGKAASWHDFHRPAVFAWVVSILIIVWCLSITQLPVAQYQTSRRLRSQ